MLKEGRDKFFIDKMNTIEKPFRLRTNDEESSIDSSEQSGEVSGGGECLSFFPFLLLILLLLFRLSSNF